MHPQGICESETVGPGTRVWAFAHVLPGARLGADCNICDHVFLENEVVLGDRVTIKCNVAVFDGVHIEDDVFVGPGVAFTNDPFPRSKKRLAEYPLTTIRRGASLGANCTVLPGITVGVNAMAGAGSVLTRDVPPNAIVIGNPARIVGYADASDHGARMRMSPSAHLEDQERVDLRIPGAYLQRLVRAEDLRGTLVAGETGGQIPFTPARFFTVMHVPSKDVRGAHAHRLCEQFLTCQAGSVSVVLDDGVDREEILLDDPAVGLLIPRMVWGIQYRYTPDALLLVLASRPYEAHDYIRDYDEFLSLAAPGDDR